MALLDTEILCKAYYHIDLFPLSERYYVILCVSCTLDTMAIPSLSQREVSLRPLTWYSGHGCDHRDLRPSHTTKIFTKIFLKKNFVKIYKTVEKIVTVVKKVEVCTDNDYFLCSFSCSVRGP